MQIWGFQGKTVEGTWLDGWMFVRLCDTDHNPALNCWWLPWERNICAEISDPKIRARQISLVSPLLKCSISIPFHVLSNEEYDVAHDAQSPSLVELFLNLTVNIYVTFHLIFIKLLHDYLVSQRNGVMFIFASFCNASKPASHQRGHGPLQYYTDVFHFLVS